MLGIPEKDNIPLTLLRKITKTEIGMTIRNPAKQGRLKIKVTRLLKKRAIFASTVKTKWNK